MLLLELLRGNRGHPVASLARTSTSREEPGCTPAADTTADKASRLHGEFECPWSLDAAAVNEAEVLAVALRGELASILSLCSDTRQHNAPEAGASGALQIELVAGTGFEPVTFRL